MEVHAPQKTINELTYRKKMKTVAEYGRKERFEGSRAQTGNRNMAATRFSDSATPTCFNTKSRPKYTTTSGLTSTTFFANFSENS